LGGEGGGRNDARLFPSLVAKSAGAEVLTLAATPDRDAVAASAFRVRPCKLREDRLGSDVLEKKRLLTPELPAQFCLPIIDRDECRGVSLWPSAAPQLTAIALSAILRL
jgi:hypothetical protein